MFQFQHCVQNKTSRFARGDIKSDEINIWRYRLITGQDVTDGQTRPFLTRLCTTTQLLMLRPPALLHALSRSFRILCSCNSDPQCHFLSILLNSVSVYKHKQVVYKHNQDSEAAVLGTGNKSFKPRFSIVVWFRIPVQCSEKKHHEFSEREHSRGWRGSSRQFRS